MLTGIFVGGIQLKDHDPLTVQKEVPSFALVVFFAFKFGSGFISFSCVQMNV